MKIHANNSIKNNADDNDDDDDGGMSNGFYVRVCLILAIIYGKSC